MFNRVLDVCSKYQTDTTFYQNYKKLTASHLILTMIWNSIFGHAVAIITKFWNKFQLSNTVCFILTNIDINIIKNNQKKKKRFLHSPIINNNRDKLFKKKRKTNRTYKKFWEPPHTMETLLRYYLNTVCISDENVK